MTDFILQVMPYIAVTIFVLGMIYRIARWFKARIVHNIVLTPAPETKAGAAGRYITEIAFFKSLFKGDKSLWAGAWIMHVTLAGIIAGHIVGFAFLGKQFVYVGLSEGASKYLSELFGTAFGIIIAVALLYLLYRRIAIEEVRISSYVADYLHLLLLLGIVSAGNFMRLVPGYSVDYEVARTYIAQLLTFQPITIDPQMNIAFVIHVFLVQILLIVFPFSKLLHLPGIFVNRWIIDRPYVEPAPGLPGAKPGSGVSASGKSTEEV